MYLFPNIKHNQIIECYKNKEYEKADICIKINNCIKYVSIKMGIRNSVHSEKLQKFIKFLKTIQINDDIVNKICMYHFADGSIDGTGKNRMPICEYKKYNHKSIKEVNEVFNNKYIIKKMIDRFIIKGTSNQYNKIDILLYGIPTDFFWLTRNDIYDLIFSKRNCISSAIHISCLTYQAFNRKLKNMEYRSIENEMIQIKWYNLEDNIIEFLNNCYLNNKNNI